MKKKIVLSGYYGFDNAGDEGVMGAIIQGLKAVEPDIPLVVLSNQPEKTARDWQVEAVNRWDYKAVWRLFGESSVLVSGGGSLLQDVTGIKSLLYYLGIMVLARLRHNKVAIYAQGIGPVRSRFGRWLTGLVLKKAAYISVRDENSARDLTDMGVPQDKIQVTADPCLAWQYKCAPIDLPEGTKIGVSLRKWKGADAKIFAAAADALAEKGYRIIFLPFHWPQDRDFALQVMEAMQHQDMALLVDQCLAPQTMFATIRQMEMMVSMRLHGLIMAANEEVPAVAISYDPKVTSFAHNAQMTIMEKLECLTAEELLACFEEVLRSLDEKKSILAEKKQQWQAAYERTNGDVVNLWKKE